MGFLVLFAIGGILGWLASIVARGDDGRSIAFDSDRDGGNEIYVMAADGSAVRRITISPGGDLAPMWVRVAD